VVGVLVNLGLGFHGRRQAGAGSIKEYGPLMLFHVSAVRCLGAFDECIEVEFGFVNSYVEKFLQSSIGGRCFGFLKAGNAIASVKRT
jgi:hypothetical protein